MRTWISVLSKATALLSEHTANTILLAANPNPRTTENPYQDYDLADGIWKACEYFVKEYLHYDPTTTLTTPVANNGISVDIENYTYTDPYTAPELKENAAEDIDGFAISGYGGRRLY